MDLDKVWRLCAFLDFAEIDALRHEWVRWMRKLRAKNRRGAGTLIACPEAGAVVRATLRLWIYKTETEVGDLLREGSARQAKSEPAGR